MPARARAWLLLRAVLDQQPQTNVENATKASPTKRGTVTCTIPVQMIFSGPAGSMTIQGSVTGFFTPNKPS